MTNPVVAEYVFRITLNKKWNLVMQVKYPPIQNNEILKSISDWCWNYIIEDLLSNQQDGIWG